MAENMFNWQFNTIPGLANQGAILMTRNNITEPPFQQSDFIWKAMEDVIGVANVKFEYDETNNKYHIYKAKGHQNNQGQWSYTWEEYGTWDALPEEVVETLRAMTYIQYRFVTQDVLGNTVLTIYGVRKTGVEDVIATITFTSKTYVDNTIDALRQNLMVYINKKWEYKGQVSTRTNLSTTASFGNVYLVEDESDLYINISETTTPSWKPFTQIAENFTVYAIELHKGTNGLYGKLRYDTIDFLIDNAQNLKAQIIDDTLDASSPLANRKTYSINKILQILSSSMRYKGQVNYYDLLPTTGNNIGDTWNVKYSGTSSQGGTDLDGDNYCWSGTSWDDLSGEYRAGVGIQIEGKVISATGISFNVGSGIKITGSGSSAVLETRNGDGLEYQNVGTSANPINANKVKPNSNKGIQVTSSGVEAKIGDGLVFDANGNIKSNGNYAYRPWLTVSQPNMATFLNQLIGQRITENTPLSIELDLTSVATPAFNLESGANYFFLLDGWFEISYKSDAITTIFENIYVRTTLKLGNQDTSSQKAFNQGSQGQTPYIGYAVPYAMRASYREPNSTNKFSVNISVGTGDSVVVDLITVYELKVFAIKK